MSTISVAPTRTEYKVKRNILIAVIDSFSLEEKEIWHAVRNAAYPRVKIYKQRQKLRIAAWLILTLAIIFCICNTKLTYSLCGYTSVMAIVLFWYTSNTVTRRKLIKYNNEKILIEKYQKLPLWLDMVQKIELSGIKYNDYFLY